MTKLCLCGVITTNCEKMLDSSLKYYKSLYSKSVNTVQFDILEHFLGQARIKKLSEEDGLSCEVELSCEGLITIEESVKVPDTFEKGKTPGNDGMPAEFSKTFWSSVTELMTNNF